MPDTKQGTKLDHLIESADGRKWSVEVFCRGEKVKITDIMSPTGYHEWVDAEQAGVKWTHPPAIME